MATPPTFTNSTAPGASTLTALGTDIDNLAQITLGTGTGLAASNGLNPSSKPMCRAYTQNVQALPTATLQVVGWEAVSYDTDNHLVLVSNTFLTVRLAGWYRIAGQVAFGSLGGGAGERQANIHINGTATGNIVASRDTQATTATTEQLQVVAFEHLAASSQVYLSAYQASGSSKDLLGNGSWGCWLALEWACPY